MQFPKGYFEGQEREGFYIEPMMKRYWAAQIEVLSIINDICEKYDIKYFAFWGTLLGTVRHKGFIPWDDDLDIAMEREDFDRFFEVAQNEIPKEYKLLSIYNDPEWEYGIGRIVNDTKIIIDKEKLKQFHGCPFAVGIDIFPYDHIPDNATVREEQNNIVDLIKTIKTAVAGTIVECKKNNAEVSYVNEIHEGLDYLEGMFGFQFNREIHLLNQLNCLYDQIYSSYGSKSDMYLTSYMEREQRQNDFKIPAYWVSDVIELPFENTYIKVPKFYEACLSACYGPAYMIPVKEGVSGHDYPAYKMQMGFMEEQNLCGIYELIMQSFDNDYLSDSVDLAAAGSDSDEMISELDNGKKNILYCVGTTDLYQKEEECIHKIINTLDYLRKRDDVNILFAYDPLIIEMLEWEKPSLIDRFTQATDDFVKKGYCIYFEYSNIDSAINHADAYFGTNGEHVKKMQLKNKPVMIQNIGISYN